MKVAIAGLGSAAVRGHLPAIARLAARGSLALVGAADPDAARREHLAASAPGVALFETAEAMLDAVECDLLVIAAQPGAHAQLVQLGLERGLHVVCEKPLVVTRAQYELVARAHVRQPAQGVVSVHQYRYSPTWQWFARSARLARRLRIPFCLTVDVERIATDALAASAWRADAGASGGMLADHGVHYLALAWTVDEQLDVLAAARAWSDAGERSGASIRVGSGTVAIQVATGAPVRSTCVTLHAANAALAWRDETLELTCRGRRLFARRVEALADRTHVDALYARLYDDLVRNLERTAWRAHRTAEALAVARALVALLE